MSTAPPIDRVARAAVAVAAGLSVLKLGAYLATGAVSVLASFVDSLLDAGVSLINFYAIRFAARPPDAGHRYGHGKAESLAGVAQALAITGSALYLGWQAVARLIEPAPPQATLIGVAAMVIAMLATMVLVHFQRRTIAATGSIAIRADSLHYASDVLVNGSVLVALLLAESGFAAADPLCALAVSAWILVGAGRLGLDAVQMLLDQELPDDVRARAIDLCCAHPAVVRVNALRSRRVGRVPHFQIDLAIDGATPLRRAHAIGAEVAAAIAEAFPDADVTVHHDPA